MADSTQVNDHPSSDASAQSAQDQGPASAPGVDSTTTTSQDSDEPADATTDTGDDDLSSVILSEAEQDAINAIEDPAKRAKAFNKAATTKFQRLSADRRALAPLRDFQRALEADGPAAIRKLAEQYGLEINDPKASTAAAATVDLTQKVTDVIKASLGPEYEDLADRLAPGVMEAVKAAVAETIKPIQTGQEELIRDSAVRETQAVMDAFTKTHPDWQQHEAAMTDLARKLPPGTDAKGQPLLTQPEYLDLLYRLVTQDRRVGDGVKQAVARMEKSAAAAVKDAKGVGSDKVTERPPKPLTFDEAAALARKGIRVE